MSEQATTMAIGVDLGATKIAAALVSARGEVLGTRQVLTGAAEGPPAVLDRIAQLIDELTAEFEQISSGSAARLIGVGLGTPGQVYSHTGIVRNAVNLGWGEVPLVQEIQARLATPLPVWIQKDANASALGEFYFGAAQGCLDFVYLGVGSGLGGGVLTNGRLVTGAEWNAAELGHLSLDPDSGQVCACGIRGCAETVVSGPGLLALAERYLADLRFPSRLAAGRKLTTAEVLTAARAGDELALAVFNEGGRWLGMVMAACAGVLNPAMMVLGGGMGLAAFDLLVPAARVELERRVLPASYLHLQIVPSRLASSAVGAAGLAWYFVHK